MKLIMESWRKYLDEQVSQNSSSGLASLLSQIQKDIKNNKTEIDSRRELNPRLKKAQIKLKRILEEIIKINTIKACTAEEQRRVYDEYLNFVSNVEKGFDAARFREDLTFDGQFEEEGGCIEYVFSHLPPNWRELSSAINRGSKVQPIEGHFYYPRLHQWFLKSHPKYSPSKVSYLSKKISRRLRDAHRDGSETIGQSYFEKLPEELKKLISKIGNKKSLGETIVSSTMHTIPYSYESFKHYAMKSFNKEAKEANDNFITKRVVAGVLGKNWFPRSTAAVDRTCQWAWSLATGGLQENTDKASIAVYVLLESTYYIFKQFGEISKELQNNKMTAFSIYRNEEIEKLCKQILNTLAKEQITPSSVLIIGTSLDNIEKEFRKNYSKLSSTIKAINSLKLLALQVYKVSKI